MGRLGVGLGFRGFGGFRGLGRSGLAAPGRFAIVRIGGPGSGRFEALVRAHALAGSGPHETFLAHASAVGAIGGAILAFFWYFAFATRFLTFGWCHAGVIGPNFVLAAGFLV